MANKIPIYDVVVVGAGLMGSAAARHLAEMGLRVALVGPAEPPSKENHQGVFASYYDQARITRKLDSDGDWSRLAENSISRYPEIERKGKQTFFTPAGSVMAGPEEGDGCDFILDVQHIGAERDIPHTVLRGAELRERFPFFNFPSGVLALHEELDAGWINPRHHIIAETEAAKAHGAVVYRDEVTVITQTSGEVHIHCAQGKRLVAGKAIVACGAFSKASGLLPQPPAMKVFARTVTYFELGTAEIARLSNMPSLVYVSPDGACEPYILPPVKYANGKTYLKIGGDPVDVELETEDDVKAWFKGGGDESVGTFLAEQLLKLMPDLDYRGISFDSCVTSYTPSGKPLIHAQTDRLIALTGGNGAGAKCADELGRLGALVAAGENIPDNLYDTSFQP